MSKQVKVDFENISDDIILGMLEEMDEAYVEQDYKTLKYLSLELAAYIKKREKWN